MKPKVRRGYWGMASQKVIQEAFIVWYDFNKTMPGPDLSESEKVRLFEMIRKFYPFGERKHFPYKAWLKELRLIKEYLWPKHPVPIQEGLFEVSDSA